MKKTNYRNISKNNNSNSNFNFNSKKKLNSRKRKNSKMKLFLFVIFIYLVLAIVSTIKGVLITKGNKIGNNTYLNGKNISNKNYTEIEAIINKDQEEINKYNFKLVLKEEEKNSYEKKLENIFQIDSRKVLDKVKNNGLKEVFKISNILRLKYLFGFKNSLDYEINIDNDKLNTLISEALSEIEKTNNEKIYKVEDNTLIVKPLPTKESYDIKEIADFLKEKVIKNLKTENNDFNIEIDLKNINKKKIETKEINKENLYSIINFEAIKEELNNEDKDFVDNIDDIVNKYLESDKSKSFEVELKEKENPNKEENNQKRKEYPNATFDDEIISFTSTYDVNNKEKETNLKVASSYINGKILNPGDIFSYDDLISPCTYARGFVDGNAYIGGKVVKEVGGGVCQVSSTLYNAALLSNMDIVERYNHMFPVVYAKPGRDATFYDYQLDFRFKNTKNHPIKILTSAQNGIMSVRFMGKKDDNISVKIVQKVLSEQKEEEEIRYSDELFEGEEKVLVEGAPGCSVETYREIYDNGVFVRTEKLSTDRYKPLTNIIVKGTKKRN